MATLGRRRLTLVTALTVASLLVGSTAISVMADNGRDSGKRGNGGPGNQEHAQVVQNQQQHGNGRDTADRDQDATHTPTPTATATTAATVTMTPTATAKPTEVEEHENHLVTGSTRPGLGCGDDNHEHTGAPGNPNVQCHDRGGNDGGPSGHGGDSDTNDD